MMLLRNPFFDDFDDDYGYSPYNRGCSQRQGASPVESRRRAEMERYYRRKELLDEQERLQQRQELIRWQKERKQKEDEEEYMQAHAAVIRRRRWEAEEEHHLRQQQLRQLQIHENDESHHEEQQQEPVVRLVQGPNGRSYRINMGHARPERPTSKAPVDKENCRRTPRDEPVVVARRGSSERAAPNVVEEQPESNKPVPTTNRVDVGAPQHYLPKQSKKEKKSKKRMTMIVEDASESEAEDDEFHSVWHNRRPSAGEWMEPVENFENLNI
jgi:hypothetical protein